jgi:hypothetical protein
MEMHLKTVEVNAAALEAACVARGAAGGRAFPAKCNHQDLLSSLSVLPVPPGGKQRACLHGNPGVLDASRDFLARNSCRDNAISAEPEHVPRSNR